MAVTFNKAPTSAPAPRKRSRGRPRKDGSLPQPSLPAGVTWEDMGHEYLSRNLDDPKQPFTLMALATKYDIPFTNVKDASYRYHWQEQLSERRLLQRGMIQAQIAQLVVNEAEVRRRQAEMAETVALRAFQRLCELDPSELSARDARMMLEMGLVQQRKALGMAEAFVFLPGSETAGKTVQDAIAEHEKVKRVGAAFLLFLKAKAEGTLPVQDVVATDVAPRG